MDFLGVGGWEIFLILLIVLILWGPSRIVDIAITLGKIVRNLKKGASDLASQITKELADQKKENPPQDSKKQPVEGHGTRQR